jgi:hypothetical protein
MLLKVARMTLSATMSANSMEVATITPFLTLVLQSNG